MIPESAWPLLNFLLSARGDGPLVTMPTAERVSVVLAHPDDEIGCAGLIARLVAGGAAVSVTYATAGEATRGSPYPREETAERRRAEATTACALLGTNTPQFLGFGDGTLESHVPALAARLSGVLTKEDPEIVLSPWFLDGHPDHRAVSRALGATDIGPDVEIWGFEWWTPLVPNRLVDVSSVIEQKRRVAAVHTTAALAFDLEAGLGLARWRSLSGLHGKGYAEAYLAASRSEHSSLIAQSASTPDA
jgi:LmbE family N-acetylglucosaminyl deacetylase